MLTSVVERSRAVYCVLLMDTQLSAFWNQHVSRQLSIFAHNVPLPCPRSQWEALTASDWFRVREAAKATASNHNNSPSTHNKTSTGGIVYNYPQNSTTTTTNNQSSPPTASTSKSQRSGYLPGLHPEFQVGHVSDGYSSAILSALAGDSCLTMPFKVDLDNVLSVEMVFMGLMAIAWDCRTRGGMGIRFKDGTKHWRGVVHNCESLTRTYTVAKHDQVGTGTYD